MEGSRHYLELPLFDSINLANKESIKQILEKLTSPNERTLPQGMRHFDPYALNEKGHSFLTLALSLKQNDIAKDLIVAFNKFNQTCTFILTNIPDAVGNTPLHYACMLHNSYETILNLLTHGALPFVYNKKTETPLDLAIKNEDRQAINALARGGALIYENITIKFPKLELPNAIMIGTTIDNKNASHFFPESITNIEQLNQSNDLNTVEKSALLSQTAIKISLNKKHNEQLTAIFKFVESSFFSDFKYKDGKSGKTINENTKNIDYLETAGVFMDTKGEILLTLSKYIEELKNIAEKFHKKYNKTSLRKTGLLILLPGVIGVGLGITLAIYLYNYFSTRAPALASYGFFLGLSVGFAIWGTIISLVCCSFYLLNKYRGINDFRFPLNKLHSYRESTLSQKDKIKINNYIEYFKSITPLLQEELGQDNQLIKELNVLIARLDSAKTIDDLIQALENHIQMYLFNILKIKSDTLTAKIFQTKPHDCTSDIEASERDPLLPTTL